MQFTNLNQIKNWRRQLHQHPELSLQEHQTAAFIRQELDKMGIAYVTPMETATVAYLKGQGEEAILLRADIDALPIQEANAIDFKSKQDGVMHACGHDAHASMLLGALHELTQKYPNGQLPINIVAVFQPSEETFGGGNLLIQAHDFSPYKIKAAYALHVNPDYQEGQLASRIGGIMASCREYSIEVQGQSAHVAMREKGINAMLAAGQIMQEIQALTSFRLNSFHTNIVHVGTFESGQAVNVVPDFARLAGTIRTYDAEDLALILKNMQAICDGVALASGSQVTLQVAEGYPAVINDPTCFAIAKAAAEKTGAQFITQEVPYLMGEDFSFFAQVAPINYSFVGIRNEALNYTSGLHTPTLQLREEALVYGVDYFVQVVEAYGKEQACETLN